MQSRSSLGYCLTFLLLWVSGISVAEPLPIPDPKNYSAFLAEPWKPDAPSLIVFKDPFCPYCIDGFRKISRLSHYNVYVFWRPIFGERSERRIDEFFRCTKPVNVEVVESVIERKTPDCIGEPNQTLVKLNAQMGEAYKPNAVPAYFFGGKRIALSQLGGLTASVTKLEATVALQWERYEHHRFNNPNHNLGRVAVVLPKNFTMWPELLEKISQQNNYQWYVFLDESHTEKFQNVCSHLNVNCDQESFRNHLLTASEIKLLFGLDDLAEERYILNGKILTNEEIGIVLPKILGKVRT